MFHPLLCRPASWALPVAWVLAGPKGHLTKGYGGTESVLSGTLFPRSKYHWVGGADSLVRNVGAMMG